MTLMVAWAGLDCKNERKAVASIYFAADSRYTWSSGKINDFGQKVFGCISSPEIFALCGDVCFPKMVIRKIIGLIDNDHFFEETETADNKAWKIEDLIRENLKNYDKIIYTGMIDKFFDYKLGELEYRSLRFETEEKDVGNYQGNAVINYTDAETPYTRVIEHKHFEFGKGDPDKTIITREYPADWHRGDEPYYPINNERNNGLYQKYAELAKKQDKVIFGGRLGQYKYYNMDQVIGAALITVKNEFEG